MENLRKNKKELIQELHNLNLKYNTILALQKKDLIHYENKTNFLNSVLKLHENKINKLAQKQEGILSELTNANIELDFQNEEKGERAEELAIANIELTFQN
jgi:hypothetical protein